jgi:PKD repeat protein
VCLTDAQLRAELQSFITSQGLPHDTSHEYFLMFPPGVENCFTSSSSSACSLGTNAVSRYCAYHSASTAAPSSTAFIYSNDPYVTDTTPNTNNGCDVANNHPNGTSDGALIGGLSHEHNESTTDPFPNTAWTDYSNPTLGFENGDKCSAAVQGFPGSFGTPLGTAPNGAPFNQLINGHQYMYQQEWTNQGSTCVQRFTFSGSEPTAQFTSTPGSGNTMNYDASGSTAPGGVFQYHWQFENTQPGFSETESSSPTTSHTYGASGNHTVSLTVYAPDGTSIGASRVISTGTAGPTASFSINPTQVLTGQASTLTSSSTAGSGDAVSQQTWNFGDGAGGSGASVSHAYATPGNYPVTLMVTTTLGQTTSTTKQLRVTGPPAATFTASPTQVAAGSPVALDGSGSSEANGSISGYSWDFGDGATGSGVSTSHAYSHAGTYTITLTASDPGGHTSQGTHQVVVVGTPSALITSAASTVAGIATAFSGSGSTDNGSSITSYSWNFGDGSTATGVSPTHTFASAGTYTVSLVVTDLSGSTSSATRAIAVTAATTIKPPTAKITSFSVKTGKKVEKITLVLSGPGTLSVGKRRITIKHAGKFVYTLTLSKAQRNRLHHHHSVKIKLTFKFKPTVGSSSSKTVSFKVKG